MPRDGAAALKAWAKRKRAEGGARDLPGLSTIAAVRGVGGGVLTRAAVLRAYGAVGQAKDKLARNRLAAGELPSVGPRRMATGTSGVSLSTPPSGAKGWPRPSGSKDSKSMPIEPSVHGPKPKGGPMAGMATDARKAIGAKAAEKRKANKAAADKIAGDEQMKKLDAMNANKKNPDTGGEQPKTGDGGDLFGRKRDASVIDQDGSPLPRADISKSKTTDAQFFSDLDAHLAPLKNKPVRSEEIEHDGVMPKVKFKYEDGTRGSFKGDDPKFFGHRAGIKNRDFQPGAREEAAYALDKILNLGVVPAGVVTTHKLPRDPDRGFSGGIVTGSKHQWATGERFVDMRREQIAKVDGRSVARVAVLDSIIGHTDRHGKNALIDGDKLVAIDNGHTFPAMMADRTQAAFRGFAMGPRYVLPQMRSLGVKADVKALAEIRTKLDRIDVDSFAKRYKMSEGESRGLKKRIDWVKKTIDKTPDRFIEKMEGLNDGW